MGSVIYNCCWSSPAQSFSGLSPAGLMTILYCLRFDSPPKSGGPGLRIYIPKEQGGPDIPPGTWFPFVTSYDSQGYGGGSPHVVSARIQQKTHVLFCRGDVFTGRSLAKSVSSGTNHSGLSAAMSQHVKSGLILTVYWQYLMRAIWDWATQHVELKHLHSGSALEGQTGRGHSSFCLHGVCQQYYTTPENFQEMSWSCLHSCVELVHFREVYTEEGALSRPAARVTEHVVLITFSASVTSVHYINGGEMSTFGSLFLSFFPYSNILFLHPFPSLFSCFSSVLPDKCPNKKEH
jgi:hypothetical protein